MRSLGLFSALAAASLVACTSLLGDFTTSNAVGGNTGDAAGGSDGATSDGAAPDGSADAHEAGPPPPAKLACDQWRYKTPTVVVDLSTAQGGARYFGGRLTTRAPSPGALRMVVGSSSGSNSPFDVYTYDKTTAAVTVTSAPSGPLNSNAYLQRIGRIGGGVAALAQRSDGATSNSYSYWLYPVPDAMPAAGPLPAPQQLLTAQAVFNANSAQVAFLEVQPNDYFVAVSFQDPNSTKYNFGIARSSGQTITNLRIIDQRDNNDFDQPVLVHFGSSVVIFVSGNDKSGNRVAQYVVPDNGNATVVQRREVSTMLSTVFDAVPGTAPGTTNVAYAEASSPDGGQVFDSIRITAAALQGPQLTTFRATDLPPGRTYTDVSQAPIGEMQPRFEGDDFVIMGQGAPNANGITSPGMNFLWMDARGFVRGERVGQDALLTDRDVSSIGSMSVTFASRSATETAIDVVWIETVKTVDGGNYQKMLYDELVCH